MLAGACALLLAYSWDLRRSIYGADGYVVRTARAEYQTEHLEVTVSRQNAELSRASEISEARLAEAQAALEKLRSADNAARAARSAIRPPANATECQRAEAVDRIFLETLQ